MDRMGEAAEAAPLVLLTKAEAEAADKNYTTLRDVASPV